MQKIKYLIKDNRMPYYLPSNYFRARKAIPKKNKKKLGEFSLQESKSPIRFALTFDVECDFGLSQPIQSFSAVKPFLKEITKILYEREIKATFFVQGSIIAQFHSELRKLEEGEHELGLHGFNHELWGGDWFVKDNPISIEQRKQAIKKSLETFAEHSLKKPVSFRAPYMVIDVDSLSLLSKAGFKVDSSYPSYKGILPLISQLNSIIEAPVTVNPKPKLQFKKIIPFSYFEVFNMKNLIHISDQSLLNFIKNVLCVQKYYQQPLHLVFLAHSWEFAKISNPPRRCEYGSAENYEILLKKFNLIKNNFPIEFITMGELAKAIG